MRISTLVSALVLSVGLAVVRADVLTRVAISVAGTGGSGGSGTSASDMVFATYGADGWGWAGGAGGVQGNAAVTNTGGVSAPANEAFRFPLGSQIDTLNATYGAGNWSVENVTLSFASSYARQNNSRFGVGSGTFDIYWVANDVWAQSKGTADDRGLNPLYASTEAGLATWAGATSLLGSETFTVAGSGYVNLSYSLAATPKLVADLLAASAGRNPDVTLYLMGTSDSLGMIIFTGGQGQPLPTLAFDVIAVPEPSALLLLGCSAAISFLCRRK